MNKFITWLKDQQGLVAMALATLLFAASPYIINSIWPLDPGVMPGSYFAIVSLAAVLFFSGTYFTWASFQLDFWELDKHWSKIKEYFEDLSSIQKICTLIVPFFVLLAFYAFCLGAAVKILSTR